MVFGNKAQASVLAFMLAIVLILLALALAPQINQITNDAMNETNSFGEVGGMNCSSSTITNFTKAACWTVDIGQAYFIGGLIALAGVIIAARIIFG